jgi:hypothetical protein
MTIKQSKNFIPISGPATRIPIDGNEPDFRPSIGFTPKWFNDRLNISFSETWHKDPMIRYQSLILMKTYLSKEFIGVDNFKLNDNYHNFKESCATISGAYGAVFIPAMYGLKVHYGDACWPSTDTSEYFSKQHLMALKPFDVADHPQVQELLTQMDIIGGMTGKIDGYMNWQGVLNTAFRLRGGRIFIDMVDDPDFVHFLFDHIHNTMLSTIKLVQEKQRRSGFYININTISNCVINLISPEYYREFVMPYDIKMSKQFEYFGIHTCSWRIDPYIDDISSINNVGYIDMGMISDMKRAKECFPDARRCVSYRPVDLENKSIAEISNDFIKIYNQIGPCDIELADIEYTMDNEKVREVLKIIKSINDQSKV